MSKKEKQQAGIAALVVNIGDTQVKITPEEARDLYHALHTMYGEKVREYIPTMPIRPWWDRPYYWGASYGNISLQAQPGAEIANQISYAQDLSKEIDWQKIQEAMK